MNWHGTIALEGHETKDGRIVEPGALGWPDEPIPLTVIDGDRRVHIGWAGSVRRDGPLIVASGSIFPEANMIPILERVEIGTMQVPVAIELALVRYRTDDDVLVCTSAWLRRIAIAAEPAWPETRITLDIGPN